MALSHGDFHQTQGLVGTMKEDFNFFRQLCVGVCVYAWLWASVAVLCLLVCVRVLARFYSCVKTQPCSRIRSLVCVCVCGVCLCELTFRLRLVV